MNEIISRKQSSNVQIEFVRSPEGMAEFARVWKVDYEDHKLTTVHTLDVDRFIAYLEKEEE